MEHISPVRLIIESGPTEAGSKQATSPPKTCSGCGKKSPHGRKRKTGICRDCWLTDMYNSRKINICTCGAKIPTWGGTRCQTCYDLKRAAKTAHCEDCGKQLKQLTTKRCRPCFLKHMSTLACQERFAQGRATGKGGARTSLTEEQGAQLLDRLGIVYERQVPYGRWVVDFYLPELDTYLEVHGAYWHDMPKVMERDQRKREKIEIDGHRVIFWRTDHMHFWAFDFVPELVAR